MSLFLSGTRAFPEPSDLPGSRNACDEYVRGSPYQSDGGADRETADHGPPRPSVDRKSPPGSLLVSSAVGSGQVPQGGSSRPPRSAERRWTAAPPQSHSRSITDSASLVDAGSLPRDAGATPDPILHPSASPFLARVGNQAGTLAGHGAIRHILAPFASDSHPTTPQAGTPTGHGERSPRGVPLPRGPLGVEKPRRQSETPAKVDRRVPMVPPVVGEGSAHSRGGPLPGAATAWHHMHWDTDGNDSEIGYPRHFSSADLLVPRRALPVPAPPPPPPRPPRLPRGLGCPRVGPAPGWRGPHARARGGGQGGQHRPRHAAGSRVAAGDHGVSGMGGGRQPLRVDAVAGRPPHAPRALLPVGHCRRPGAAGPPCPRRGRLLLRAPHRRASEHQVPHAPRRCPHHGQLPRCRHLPRGRWHGAKAGHAGIGGEAAPPPGRGRSRYGHRLHPRAPLPHRHARRPVPRGVPLDPPRHLRHLRHRLRRLLRDPRPPPLARLGPPPRPRRSRPHVHRPPRHPPPRPGLAQHMLGQPRLGDRSPCHRLADAWHPHPGVALLPPPPRLRPGLPHHPDGGPPARLDAPAGCRGHRRGRACGQPGRHGGTRPPPRADAAGRRRARRPRPHRQGRHQGGRPACQPRGPLRHAPRHRQPRRLPSAPAPLLPRRLHHRPRALCGRRRPSTPTLHPALPDGRECGPLPPPHARRGVGLRPRRPAPRRGPGRGRLGGAAPSPLRLRRPPALLRRIQARDGNRGVLCGRGEQRGTTPLARPGAGLRNAAGRMGAGARVVLARQGGRAHGRPQCRRHWRR